MTAGTGCGNLAVANPVYRPCRCRRMAGITIIGTRDMTAAIRRLAGLDRRVVGLMTAHTGAAHLRVVNLGGG